MEKKVRGEIVREIMQEVMQEVMKEVERRLTFAIESVHEKLNLAIGFLRADIVGLKSDVSVLKSDVSTLKSDVSTLKADVSTVKRDVTTLKTEMKLTQAAVLEVGSQVRENRMAIGRLETRFDRLDQRMTLSEGDIKQLQSAV